VSGNYPQRRAARLALAGCIGALVVAGGLLAQEAKHPPTGLRIFYTGHSFHMFVPPYVQLLAKAAGTEGHVEVGRQGIGGSRVIQHWEKADDQNGAKKALQAGNVDVFTMAAHVQIPDEGITKFTELGLAHNPNLRLLVQASWFPFDVPEPEKRVRENAQRDSAQIDDLQKAVDDWRQKLEAQVDELNRKHGKTCLFIVPVGDAVVKLRSLIVDGKYPGVTRQSELFTDPIGHGTAHVQALASYCNYVAIYRHNPLGLAIASQPANKKAGPALTDVQHAILQRIAWETVSAYPYAGLAAKAAAAP
jgi:hypothetical protein